MDPITLDASLRPSPSLAATSDRPSTSAVLTTFPNLFEDEPESGLLPTLFTRVKNTLVAASSVAVPAAAGSKPDKGSGVTADHGRNTSLSLKQQTEAQAIAEAERRRNARRHEHLAPDRPIPSPAIPSLVIPEAQNTSKTSPTDSTPIVLPQSLRPPSASGASTSSSNTASSVAPSSLPSRRLVPPGERRWRPTGAAPAQVTISPVTSVTTTVQATKSIPISPESSLASPPPVRPVHRAHFAPSPASSFRPSVGPAARLRRSSIATIPDSPSSISLSAMIAANAEISQNASYVPGFPLPQDDTRSVRSLGFVKKSNSVSRLIRRMRGEGLSKHYWMADEHCKECYDCKSVFTAWRRKHHCRICGQIFCSRCASNIIGARRFGQDGAVRVCNLCLQIMEEYKDDDDDDRRSINSVATSVRMPSVSDRAFLDVAISPELPYSKSPFAASQLFSSNSHDGLGAIDEGVIPASWRREEYRPYSPQEYGSEDDQEATWGAPPITAAPFRRPMDEDAKSTDTKDDDNDDAPLQGAQSPLTPTLETSGDLPGGDDSRRPRRVEFPRSDTVSTEGRPELRSPLTRIDSNAPLIGLRTRLSSRASQGGLTALLDVDKPEGLWRARSYSFAQRPEGLVGPSLEHFNTMLEQAIRRSGLPNPKEWHKNLSRLLLKVSASIHPNIRSGDSIDVRAYVKIKKVPGGKISDSEYVDGIVITKNVAHKAMPRRLVNPRIMVITFPLDYHRVENQFMSLDPILAQEKDYLRLLTRRITDVRPHIVLVERAVSRIALEYLLEANLAVARSVKPSAIHQVARCTQADVVASMDRLALEPRLGRCAEFQIQSFEHDLIPGRRKTLMRFEGCQRDYGCTLILRGGDFETLKKTKVVVDFMSLVAYHQKSEIIMYSDEHNILPPRPTVPLHYQSLLDILVRDDACNRDTPVDSRKSSATQVPLTPASTAAEDNEERRVQRQEALEQSKEIARSLRPYLTTALSASAAIRFPPPAPLARMADLDRNLNILRQKRDEAEAAEILQEEGRANDAGKAAMVEPENPPQTTAMEKTISVMSDIPITTAMSAVPASTIVGKDVKRDPYRVLRKPEEVARESALTQVEHDHAEQLELWRWYTRRHSATLRPEDFQGIVYLYSLGCEGTDKPCIEPTLQALNFYQPDDVTVGQFLETLAANAAKRCSKPSCERLLLFHFQLLVHGDRRLQIAMDQFPCPSQGHEDQIITWSYCRQCATPSPTTIIREGTWKMSWGSYLEHCFYPPECSAGFACPHDAYRDQIRYFAHRNLAIRIHNEQIELFEPVRPSITLQVRAETKVVLKNREYESALHKNTAFFDSVLFRLRGFDYEIIQPEKVPLLKTALEGMLARAVADREEMVILLNRTYKLTPMTDVLALNTVLRTLQDKVVQWDSDFVDIEKAFMPSEKDLRRMTATHLKRLFANQDVFSTLDRNAAGMTVSEADEKDVKSVQGESGQTTMTTTTTTTTTTTPTTEHPPALSGDPFNDTTSVTPKEGLTPVAGVLTPAKNPLSMPPSPMREYDSESTISAHPRVSSKNEHLKAPIEEAVDSSGMESDIRPFISRLPRRSRPTPSVADMVKRFQHESTLGLFDTLASTMDERSDLASGSRRHSYRCRDLDGSDSDVAIMSRPKMRRGRTEQPPARHREMTRPGLLSDGDRSYAANASRIPSIHGRRSIGGPGDTYRFNRPKPPIAPSSPPRSRDTSPERAPSIGISKAPSLDKPRMAGKGKAPKGNGEFLAGKVSPALARASRRAFGTTRVSSIARHFDRLSEEADKQRARRNAVTRTRRARPVIATKAKVQVFDNVRDAFRDESDSASSEADNEEDEASDDSADSGQGRPRSRRKSSLSTKPSKVTAMQPIVTGPEPMNVPAQTGASVEAASAPKSSEIPISASGSSMNAASGLSDTRSEMSFTDRLQIELPQFETSAPLPSVPATPQLSADTFTADESKGKELSQMSQLSESELSSGGERSSILKTLTGLWAFRAGEYSPLEYPLSAAEHIFTDSRVIIRENEPTSIIAFTLSSKPYREKMRNNKFQAGYKVENFVPDESLSGDRASNWDIVSLDETAETDDPTRREGGTHLKYDFESGASTLFCRIFFAERFAALRAACECEDSFVESLARCVQFDASGGKSGSAFLKTKDDRFIAKEISRSEMDALTKFAPAYFEYTKNAIQGQRPTALAKIYGFFKIGYRNAITGRTMRMNVLIMENLFYERRFSKIYDLKGSTRNRLIQPTGRVNEVLLDENLMELVYRHPLYLREHSKRILRLALFNDTLFLSNLNVMDYSLVVGVDSERGELVVGIVDYIRTFTWDKKLESWVKDSTFLGGGGKGEPTIVTPKQYKTRFRTAMEKFYFPSVPDRWSKIGVEEAVAEEDNAQA